MEFTSSHELVSVIRDSLVVHRSAYAAGILHHDLSPGNIVIVKGVGYLIDWDLSKLLDYQGTSPRQMT
ncbi:hypothetical protein AZE42_13322 [Rhizopogon vesiculosus]|uniref:Protein kinase domain-containing protein n=1 Tax=Rhizopogon vesiculosus TaxID=180088 RepID=A0A1J8QBE6_9AGAM|nr:hypothetical protein AZE42_13322 [Rhizopogon vesiculosus]